MRTNTFEVDVDGMGRFVMARRTIESDLRIEHELRRLGVSSPRDESDQEQIAVGFLNYVTRAVVTLKVLVVSAPASWSMDDIDPLDGEDAYNPIISVYEEVRQAEARFREERAAKRQTPGAGNAASGGVVVPPPV